MKAEKIDKILNGEYYTKVVKYLTAGLMIAISVWIFSGIISVIFDITHIFSDGWEATAHHIIIKIITMLALLELLRTLYSYLQLGRVKVTFILDAALVVLIGELIGLWYRDFTANEVTFSLIVISVLVGLRIVTSKYSPHLEDDEDKEKDSKTENKPN